MRGKTVNLRAVPVDLIRRAKAVAAWKGMTLKAFIIDCISQAVEREWGNIFGGKESESKPEEPEDPPRPYLALKRGSYGRVLGWKCSSSCCSWEEQLPPGKMVDSVRQLFEKDAEESFARHLENCPIQRERATA